MIISEKVLTWVKNHSDNATLRTLPTEEIQAAYDKEHVKNGDRKPSERKPYSLLIQARNGSLTLLNFEDASEAKNGRSKHAILDGDASDPEAFTYYIFPTPDGMNVKAAIDFAAE